MLEKREGERENNKRERKDGEGVQVVLIIFFWDGTLGGFQLRSAGRDRTRDSHQCKGMISDGLFARNRWKERSNE